MKKLLFKTLLSAGMLAMGTGVQAYRLTTAENAHGTVAYKVNGTPATPDASGAVTVEENDEVTVTLTADDGYAVKALTGEWGTGFDAAHARRRAQGSGTIGVEDGIVLTADGENTWTFTMVRADATLAATYRKLLTHGDITVEAVGDITYDGQQHTPLITVKDGTADITGQCAFGYSGDLVNAGTVSVTISVQPSNEDYAGETATSFKIVARSLKITAQSHEFTYNGKAQSWSGYDVDGLVGSDAVSAVVTGSIQFPGESPAVNRLDSYELTSGIGRNYKVTTSDGELTMKNASQAITITSASASWTYDGEAHADASVTVTSGSLFTGDALVATATGSVTDVADTHNGNNRIAPGYRVVHGDEDVSASYVITAVDGTLTVNRADIDDLTAPAAVEGLIYSAYDQELVVAGSTAEGTVLYSLDGSRWGEAVPAAQAAATYTVHWKVAGYANYNDVAEQTLTVTIAEMDYDAALDDLDAAIKHAIGVLALVGKDMGNVEIPLVRTIYEADDLYRLAAGGGEVTSGQIVDMIRKLREAEKEFLADPEVNSEVTTGISAAGARTRTGAWSDLSGRRLQGMPARPGVYIVNGSKVVVK